MECQRTHYTLRDTSYKQLLKHLKMWISSIDLGTLAGVTYFHQCQWTEKLLMAPPVPGQHKTVAHQRGLQQVCTTCQLVQIQLTWNTAVWVMASSWHNHHSAKYVALRNSFVCESHTDEQYSCKLCFNWVEAYYHPFVDCTFVSTSLCCWCCTVTPTR